MTRSSTPVKVGGIVLISFSAILVVTEVVLHVLSVTQGHKYSINYVMLIIAAVVGFTGMYILSPPRAKDGGEFIVDNAIKIIQVMKAGRRKNDPIAAVVEDKNGQTATMIIHPPTETEVTIAPTIEDGHEPRRKTDTPIIAEANPPKSIINGDKGNA